MKRHLTLASLLLATLVILSALHTTSAAPTATPQATAIAPVMFNARWKPQFRTFDGVEMALVPPGCFMMGSTPQQVEEAVNNAVKQGIPKERAQMVFNEELPAAKICFDKPFWIDKTEVTQEQFKKFGGIAEASPHFSGDHRPVETITWFEARDFCAKRGARLPTEAEWEYAARGPDGLVYPWGNTFVANNTVYVENSNGRTAEVGSKPGGVSWVGAYDLSGNVWEWVSTLYRSYPYNAKDGRESNSGVPNLRVLRGNSWDFNRDDSHLAARYWGHPADQSDNSGFRCARAQ